MQKTYLSLALGIALFASCTATASVDAGRPSTDAFGTSGMRLIQLSDIPSLLSSTTSTGAEPRKTANTPATGTDPQVAWLPSSALSTPEARAAAADLVHSGVGVLISVTPDIPRYDIDTFGVEADGTTVLYQQLADGTLDIYSSSADAQADREHWQAMVNHTRQTMAQAQARKASTNSIEDEIPGPYQRFLVTETSPTNNGSSVSMDIRVVRDSGANRDQKVVTVNTTTIAYPFRNGVTQCGWPMDSSECAFSRTGKGKALYAPSSYRVKTMLSWPANQDPAVVKIEHYPTASAETKLSIEQSYASSYSFDWGLTAEVAGDLTKKEKASDLVGKVTPKAGFSIGETWTKTHKDSVSMETQDYSISTSDSTYSLKDIVEGGVKGDKKAALAQTSFGLSTAMAHHDYFWSSSNEVKTDRMTPMMRTAQMQTLTRWKVRGDYEGKITVSSSSALGTMAWRGNGSGPFYKDDWPLPGQAGKIPKNQYFQAHTQPVASVTIDLGSPYLTRHPTVLLQGKLPDNACLIAPSTGNKVEGKACSRNTGATEFQWYMDGLDRYVNRKTGKCLDFDQKTTDAILSTCSTAMSQKWEWRYDRLHSKTGDGLKRINWLTYSSFKVMYDPASNHFHDPIAANPTHPLLKPWSSYPDAPRSSDTVPGFSRSEAIPAEYLRYRKVEKKQMWSTVPFIFGLQ